VPPAVAIEEIGADEVPGWDAPDLIASRKYGDHWHAERRTAVLLVPSLVTHAIERNVLLNEDHPAFSDIIATDARDVNWDGRLFRR
jgi:RES domain-containing protein